jgi:hypothetical protein
MAEVRKARRVLTPERYAEVAREAGTLRRAFARQYEARRTLEAAIRRHASRECDCAHPHACLVALAQLVPRRPRPTLRQLHTRRLR